MSNWLYLLAVTSMVACSSASSDALPTPSPGFGPGSNQGYDYGTPNPGDRTEAERLYAELRGRFDHEQFLSDAMLDWRKSIKLEVGVALNTLYTDACGCRGKHWRGPAAALAPQ